MEQRACRFVKKNGLHQTNFHPLHLRTDKVKWMSAFGRFDTPCIASLTHKKNAHHSTETKLFVILHLDHHPYVYSDITKNEIEEIVVISSPEFHHHYGIDESTTYLVVGPMFAFPLSRIILSANNEETFNWANEDAFERGLMVLGTCHKNLLVRQGDQFLAPPEKTFGDDSTTILHHFQNLTTLECYPVKQGYVHAGTEVIIMENVQRETKPKKVKHIGKTKLCLISNDQEKLTSLSEEKFDLQCDAICSENTANMLKLRDGDLVRLKLSFVQENVISINDSFPSLRFNDSSEFDDDSLKDEEEYFSIDMPRTKNKSQEQFVHAVLRIRIQPRQFGIGLFAENVKLDENTLYISPVTWFNISHDGKFKRQCENTDVQIEVLGEDDRPVFAKEIHLSLFLSPTYSPSAQFDKTLMKYLSKTRILKKNDIICIKTEGNSEFLCECDIKDARCQAIYYKVVKFGEKDKQTADDYHLVDLKHTSLYQVGATNSYVPRITTGESTGLSSYIGDLKKTIRPYIAQEMDNATATVIVSGSPGCGKWSVVSSVAKQLNLHIMKISCYELMSDSSGATDAKVNTAIQRAIVYAPCIVVLSDIDCIGRDSETGQADHRVCASLQNAIESLQSEELPVAVVAITSNIAGVVSKIKSLFVHQLEIKSLSENERRATMNHLISQTQSGNDIDVQWMAKHTVGFTYGELWELSRKAIENARERITNECAVGSRLSWIDEMNICASGITNQHCDFVLAMKKMQAQRADIIGVPKIPDVKWEDIGGLEEVKNIIQDTIQLPLDHPELVASGLRRSGILLYGPPGTGKTLLAKAVATQCSLSFLSVKGPELINMYVGQSEENVRKVFSRARDAAPCVVFFDELDSLAPNRGRSGDSGGVMDRVVSQLLAELDGLIEADAERQIFVIGASNRPDLIDPALLRPGRFDKLLYVGINTNKVDQLKILEAQTRRANLSTDVRLHEVIRACPENMTGADFYALTSEALMNAIRRRIEIEEAKEENNFEKDKEMEPLVVDHIDFLNAARNINPSVSKEELLRFQEIKEQLSSK